MPPYSLDLRKKIVAAYEEGNTSIRKVAKQFQVATRTVQQLLNQYRATGELSPKVPSNKMQSPLEAHQDTILKIVAEHSDWFLWQYCEEVADKTGVSVTTGSMCRFLQRHKITLKKRPIEANE